MKLVYQLDDLLSREVLDANAELPAQFAVIGSPIGHSASPQMHQAALSEAGIPARYIRVEVAPGEVEECFSRMEKLDFIGCNVTIPHKLEAMECCDELTEEAQCLGATNTITFSDRGRIGHNTDGPGLSAAIVEAFGRPLSDFRVLILGAGGGAGRAIAMQCAREQCRSLALSNRSVDKVKSQVGRLSPLMEGRVLEVLGSAPSDLEDVAQRVDLIINATSLGLKEGDELPFPEFALKSSHCIYDAIYSPPRTALLQAAQRQGSKGANGLSMLVHQGRFAFYAWTGEMVKVETMREPIEVMLENK